MFFWKCALGQDPPTPPHSSGHREPTGGIYCEGYEPLDPHNTCIPDPTVPLLRGRCPSIVPSCWFTPCLALEGLCDFHSRR